MNDPRDHVPAYQTIRVTAPQAPAAAAADEQAWRARAAYPDLYFAGPVFGVAREREEGGWAVYPHFSGFAPQDARDNMGSVFRRLAQQAGQCGDSAAHAECMRAAERLDWEALDELTVVGTRYRVVRAERFIRTGPAGPEPPRPADPGPADPGPADPGQAHDVPDPAADFVIDPVTATGMSEGILKAELLASVYSGAAVPADVRDDSARAARTHPGGVLLPAAFMTAEQIQGRWRPVDDGTSVTPQDARDGLALYLRVTVPWQLKLGPEERAVYAAGADRLDAQRPGELEVAGRRFRVVRVERLVRVGPDGPEGPRRSDPDPQPPVMVQTQQLRGQGLLADEDTDAPIELDDDAKRFAQLFHEEEERRKTHPEKS